MKNRKIVWLLTVLAVLIIFAGCKNKLGSDSDSDSESDEYNLMLPDAMPPSSVQKFSGTAVANYTEAGKLFDDTLQHTGFFNKLIGADKLAYTYAFKKTYGKNNFEDFIESSITTDPAITEISYSVDINDSTLYKAMSGANSAKITGSEFCSFGSNLTVKEIVTFPGDILDIPKKKEDNFALTLSGNRTYEISNGFYEDAGIKVAGFVIVEYDCSIADSVIDEDKNISSLDQNVILKASMTLSVSKGTKGAKFLCSGVLLYGADKDMYRSASYNELNSNLDVYDNNDVLLFSVPPGFYGNFNPMNAAVSIMHLNNKRTSELALLGIPFLF